MTIIDPGDTWTRHGSDACAPGASLSQEAHTNERAARISLKQWRLFHAVVDNDGFVGAANKLHLSQSSISHALAKVQDQLGLPLFTLVGRKAHLTKQGEALLERSRDLVRQAVRLEEFSASLRRGWEPEVRLVVEPNFPVDLLMRAFRRLDASLHELPLSVSEMGFAELKNCLHAESVDLAISPTIVSGFPSNRFLEIEHVAVAHADNPLFKMDREIRFCDLSGHLQIVLGGVEQPPRAADQGPDAPQPRSWKVGSLDSAETALQFGLGYAWLPRYRVQRWLDDGSVRILPLDSGSSYTKQMHLIRGRSAIPGSRVLRLADLLHETAKEYGAGPAHGEGDRVDQARRMQMHRPVVMDACSNRET